MQVQLATTALQGRSHASAFSPSAAIWIKLAVAYLIAGAILGIAMGASENFSLRSVHSHIVLLGWTTLALAGLIYGAYPEAGASRLAKVHFWLHNLSLPPMMAALAALMFGNPGATPVLVASQILLVAGLVAFGWNVLANAKAS